MKLAKILVPLLACLLLAACGKGGNTNNAGNMNAAGNSANRAAAAASPTPTAVATHSSADDGAQAAHVSKPEDAAEGLFNAWKTKDRAAAQRFAADVAIDNLFKEGGHVGLQFQGCDKQGDGYLCGYSYEGGGLIMTVTGSEAEGYKVTGTAFVAD